MLSSLRFKLVLASIVTDFPKGSELRFLLVLAVTQETKLINILPWKIQVNSLPSAQRRTLIFGVFFLNEENRLKKALLQGFMKQSEMNYAHPLAFDIHPTGLFLFSLKLYFFQLCIFFFKRENDWAKSFSSNQCKIKQLIVMMAVHWLVAVMLFICLIWG